MTQCSAPGLSVTASASTNQFTTGYSYDAAGNNTGDGLNSYTYDAENRIRSANVGGTYYCYIYDGNGLRVEKATASGSACSSPTAYELYWRSISGDTLAETDGSGSTTNSSYNEYVFFAGRRIAQSNPSSGTVYYYFADHLGSTRVVTNATGAACYEGDFLPYGYENIPAGFSNTCSTNYKFTGYERDTETGLDYAFARHYNQRMGRFQSGDPLGGDISDPQTLNRYAYTRNNPVNFIDPSGMDHACSQPGGWCLGNEPGSGVDPGDGGSDGIDNGFNGSGACEVGPCPNALTNGYYAFLFTPPPQPAAPKKLPQTPGQSACKNVPNHPPGESATANLNLVNQSTQGMWPATKLAFFDEVFQTGGAFDYKTNYSGSGWGPGNGQQFVDYGNWNFGYTCGANYGSYFCQSAAGMNHMYRAAKQGVNPFGDGIPFLTPPFGDQKGDNQQIQNGAKAQASGCVQ